jgi:Fe2+ or Zn2+ uptake regulation protein
MKLPAEYIFRANEVLVIQILTTQKKYLTLREIEELSQHSCIDLKTKTIARILKKLVEYKIVQKDGSPARFKLEGEFRNTLEFKALAQIFLLKT